MKVLESKETPRDELQYAAKTIGSYAVEGLVSVGDMATKLKEMLPLIMGGFSEGKAVVNLPNLKDLAAEEQAFLRNVEQVSFAEVREFRADVPEGFSGNFLAYAIVLNDCAENLTKLGAQVLNPYTVLLGQLVSTRNAALLSDDKSIEYRSMQAKRDAAYAQINKFFATKRKEATVKIGAVVARNAEWPGIFREIKQATDRINSINRSQLVDMVAQAEDYLGIIQDMLKEGKLQAITPETAQALAEGAYQVALQLEFYALVHFRILGLSEALKSTVARVNEILS